MEGIPPRDPSASDRKLVLDGLRLQLDLRIVPGSEAGEAAAAAVWRIESDRVSTLPLVASSALRRAAMATGVAVLVAALGVWFLTNPRTDARRRAEWALPYAPTPVAPTPAAPSSAVSSGGAPHPTAPQATPPARPAGSLEPDVAPGIIAEPGTARVPPPSAASPSDAPNSVRATAAVPRPAEALPSRVGTASSVGRSTPVETSTPTLAPPPLPSARSAEQRPPRPRGSGDRAGPDQPALAGAPAGTAANVRPVRDMLEMFDDTK